ncbi:MAG: T9SS type A sorting domain-containing protein [Melioribacteraceae bacterium]|nr:T9SS type A sorting domain-containing protein [Melioribacteraceae bacterium]MCF8354151.1 T9SS type A sorting domain-containing protein [Melioribacteraceae bacterium]MCF8396035.1 T9SS type A sorting domain-containing protein [Melioribacteraceae bacterium]MCF8418074.1 T9SS type A sorting domain-containing protein [Melioribacteraceae bacterium]
MQECSVIFHAKKYCLSPSIRSELKSALHTSLSVYDILGREVKTLLNKNLEPGTYEIEFDGSDFASGVYFYQLRSGEFIDTKKFVLLK